MRKLYYAINHEYRQLIKLMTVIGISGLVVGQILIISEISSSKGESVHLWERFEEILQSSGFHILTVIMIAAWLTGFAIRTWLQLSASRSIYKYLQIPLGEKIFYFSSLIVAFVGILQLLLIQNLSLIAAFNLRYLPAIDEYSNRNALSLAYLRSVFLRLAMPLQPVQTILVLLILLLIVVILMNIIFELNKQNQSKLTWPLIQIIGIGFAALVVRWAFDPDIAIFGRSIIPETVLIAGVCALLVYRGMQILSAREIS